MLLFFVKNDLICIFSLQSCINSIFFLKNNNVLHNLNVILFPSSHASTEISFSMIPLMFVSTVMFNDTINEDYVWSINLLHCYVNFTKIFRFGKNKMIYRKSVVIHSLDKFYYHICRINFQNS